MESMVHIWYKKAYIWYIHIYMEYLVYMVYIVYIIYGTYMDLRILLG